MGDVTIDAVPFEAQARRAWIQLEPLVTNQAAKWWATHPELSSVLSIEVLTSAFVMLCRRWQIEGWPSSPTTVEQYVAALLLSIDMIHPEPELVRIHLYNWVRIVLLHDFRRLR
jgi:hypothetical protein